MDNEEILTSETENSAEDTPASPAEETAGNGTETEGSGNEADAVIDTASGINTGGEAGNPGVTEDTPVLTEEQITDAIRALIMSNIAENAEGLENVPETADSDNDTGLGVDDSGDYSEALNAILLDLDAILDSDVPLNLENVYAELGEARAADSVGSDLNDLSASNVLLCFVVVLLLVDIAFHVGKGILS